MEFHFGKGHTTPSGLMDVWDGLRFQGDNNQNEQVSQGGKGKPKRSQGKRNLAPWRSSGDIAASPSFDGYLTNPIGRLKQVEDYRLGNAWDQATSKIGK